MWTGKQLSDMRGIHGDSDTTINYSRNHAFGHEFLALANPSIFKGAIF
jgi:hypothetical protein